MSLTCTTGKRHFNIFNSESQGGKAPSKAKQDRVWGLGGTAQDAKNLDYSANGVEKKENRNNQPAGSLDSAELSTFETAAVGQMIGELRGLDESEAAGSDDLDEFESFTDGQQSTSTAPDHSTSNQNASAPSSKYHLITDSITITSIYSLSIFKV